MMDRDDKRSRESIEKSDERAALDCTIMFKFKGFYDDCEYSSPNYFRNLLALTASIGWSIGQKGNDIRSKSCVGKSEFDIPNFECTTRKTYQHDAQASEYAGFLARIH